MKRLHLSNDLISKLDELKKRLTNVTPLEEMDSIHAGAACGGVCYTTCSSPCTSSCADNCQGTCTLTCSVICDQPFIWHQLP